MPTCSSPTARCATWRRCSPTCERRRGSQRANRGSASSPPCANAGAHAPPWSRRYRCPTAASRPPAAHATSRSRASTDERGVATLAATPEPGRRNAMRMMKHCWLAMAVVLLAAGCASMGSKDDKLHEAQYAWSAAIRWGDFEGAWNLVEPEYRKANPMTPVEFERYKHVGISRYHDMGEQVLADGDVAREIDLGVINKHTMTERGMRYTERWHYDEEAKAWWQMSGLPDLWAGE